MRSPAATRASRDERCVFASWTLMQRGWCPGGPDVGLSWEDDISGLIGLVRLTGWWMQPGKRVSYSGASMLRQSLHQLSLHTRAADFTDITALEQ